MAISLTIGVYGPDQYIYICDKYIYILYTSNIYAYIHVCVSVYLIPQELTGETSSEHHN